MKGLLRSLAITFAYRRRHTTSDHTRRFRPSFEALEDRSVPAVITDYSAYAAQFSRHSGPTDLYLNFDGWLANRIIPFAGTTDQNGDNIPDRREQDIQEVLYRTAEILSPFDVQVRRIYGNGAYSSSNGNSTIFIGDDFDNNTTTTNNIRAFAALDYADSPLVRRPNNNGYDLGFVDPVSDNDLFPGGENFGNNLAIAQSVAHEAGHTFGLGHVNSWPYGEVMSYDAVNQYFADRTFSITNLNNNGTQNVPDDGVVPRGYDSSSLSGWFGYRMQTQNSYTFLRAVLGSRPADDSGNVTHSNAVQYMTGNISAVARGSIINGSIERPGDYDVFQFNPTFHQTLAVNAQRVSGLSVDPVLLIYEAGGSGPFQLVNFNNNRSSLDASSQVTMTFIAGRTYCIVVGGVDGQSSGGYRLWVAAPTDANPDRTGPRVTSVVPFYTGWGYFSHFIVNFDKDVNPSTFTTSDVTLTNVSSGFVIRPSAVQVISGTYNRQYRITVGLELIGTYILKIGPNIQDMAGNLMNQDGDGINGEATQDVFARAFSDALPDDGYIP